MIENPILAIVTSTYRAEAFLPAYATRLRAALNALNFRAEVVIIANDPTPKEGALLTQLKATLAPLSQVTLTRHDVARESLYASWNRGFLATNAPYLTVWNVDDNHTPESLIEGVRLLELGYTMVEFNYGLQTHIGITLQKPRLHPNGNVGRKTGLCPFWVMSRTLYEQAGAFDERYRIAGDYEWSIRALPHMRYTTSEVVGGTFYQHEGNLSGTGSLRQDLEFATALLLSQTWQELVPVHPPSLRQLWRDWGISEEMLPTPVQSWLWGASALWRWRVYVALRRVPALYRLYRALMLRGLVPSLQLNYPQ